MDGRDAEKHEDDCFGRTAQHLQGVLQRRLGMSADVLVYVAPGSIQSTGNIPF